MSETSELFEAFLNEPLTSTDESINISPHARKDGPENNEDKPKKFWWIKEKAGKTGPSSIDIRIPVDNMQHNSNSEKASQNSSIKPEKNVSLKDFKESSLDSSTMIDFLQKEKIFQEMSDELDVQKISPGQVDLTDDDISSIIEQLNQIAGVNKEDETPDRSVDEILKEAENVVKESSETFAKLGISLSTPDISYKDTFTDESTCNNSSMGNYEENEKISNIKMTNISHMPIKPSGYKKSESDFLLPSPYDKLNSDKVQDKECDISVRETLLDKNMLKLDFSKPKFAASSKQRVPLISSFNSSNCNEQSKQKTSKHHKSSPIVRSKSAKIAHQPSQIITELDNSKNKKTARSNSVDSAKSLSPVVTPALQTPGFVLSANEKPGETVVPKLTDSSQILLKSTSAHNSAHLVIEPVDLSQLKTSISQEKNSSLIDSTKLQINLNPDKKGEKHKKDISGNKKTSDWTYDELVNLATSHRKEIENLSCKHEEELFNLRRELNIMKAKLTELENSESVHSTEVGNSTSKYRLALLEDDVQKQETLIVGYQRENKKLCQDIKQLKVELKAKENALKTERQHLQAELMSTREGKMSESLVAKDTLLEQIKDKDELILGLQVEVESLKVLNTNLEKLKTELLTTVSNLKEDVEKYKRISNAGEQNKVAGAVKSVPVLSRQLERCKADLASKEAELRNLRVSLDSVKENLEMKKNEYVGVMADNHLQLQALEASIGELQVKLQKEQEKSKQLAKDKDIEMKKTLDLQRQVREMERILKRNNPNVSSTLISEFDVTKMTSKLKYFENRVQQLEEQLKLKDQEISASADTMKSCIDNVKVKYEEQISDLELQLSTSKHQALILKKEIDDVRKLHEQLKAIPRKKVVPVSNKSTQDGDGSVQIINTRQIKKPFERGDDAHLLATIRGLKLELTNREREVTKLSRELDEVKKTNRRLQKEREKHLHRDNTTISKLSGAVKETVKELPSIPASVSAEKCVNIDSLNGKTTEEIIEQLQKDKQSVRHDLLQLEEEFRALQTKRMEDLNTLQEHYERQIELLKHKQLQQGDTMLVAELTEEVHIQRSAREHLSNQLRELHKKCEEIEVLKGEKEHIEKQLAEISKKYERLKIIQNSDTTPAESILEMIHNLEHRSQLREERMQAILRDTLQRNAQLRANIDELKGDETVANLRLKLLEKNKELCMYRSEMDNILSTLRDHFRAREGSRN